MQGGEEGEGLAWDQGEQRQARAAGHVSGSAEWVKGFVQKGQKVVVVCFTVLGGTTKVHRTPAQNKQDFLVPTSKRAHRCGQMDDFKVFCRSVGLPQQHPHST